jgi:hypothetical protein
MLTSRERLDRCFRCKETDRPGLFIRGAGQSSPPDISYKPLRDLVTAKCDLKEAFNVNVYKKRADVTQRIESYNKDFEKYITTICTPLGELQEIFMSSLKGDPGYKSKYLLDTPEDAEKYLSIPYEGLSFDPEIFFAMDRKMGDRGIVNADLFLNPAGLVADLLGSEKFAVWSIEHREILEKLMEKEMNVQLKNIKQLVEAGIGPYFGIAGQEYITPPLHGPRDFYDFNVVYDKPIADLIHDAGGLFHVHSHGRIKGLLKYFIELGADVLHPLEAPPMGNITMSEAKQELKDRVCIEGNVQIGDMYRSTAEEIKQMAEELIRDAFYDSKGLIVCPTASPYIPVLDDQGLMNYMTLINTVLAVK